MEVRLAKKEDIPKLCLLGKDFVNASGYSDIAKYDEDSTIKLFELLIKSETLFTDGKHGMIGFLVAPLFFNLSELNATELFWWVDKEKRGTSLGIRLLKAAEEHALKLGAKNFSMLSIEGLKEEKLDSLYTKLGYSLSERIYMRRL